MQEPTHEPPRPTNDAPSLSERTGQVIQRLIECDRRSWDRMLRQFAAEERWVFRSIKKLLRPGQ